MGAGFYVETSTEPDPVVALASVTAKLSEGCYEWHDPGRKPGFVQVWDKPVSEDERDWIGGWVLEHPPEGVDPDNKWGPWMAFPLTEGGWCFFGWVNE